MSRSHACRSKPHRVDPSDSDARMGRASCAGAGFAGTGSRHEGPTAHATDLPCVLRDPWHLRYGEHRIAGWMPGRQIIWRHRRLHGMMRSHAMDVHRCPSQGHSSSAPAILPHAPIYMHACATDMQQEPRPSSRPLGCWSGDAVHRGSWECSSSAPLRDHAHMLHAQRVEICIDPIFP